MHYSFIEALEKTISEYHSLFEKTGEGIFAAQASALEMMLIKWDGSLEWVLVGDSMIDNEVCCSRCNHYVKPETIKFNDNGGILCEFCQKRMGRK